MFHCDTEKCTGCGACVQICPNSCIEMEEDAEGFLYPHVDAHRCVGCGRCETVCTNGRPLPIAKNQTAYAAVSLSAEDLQNGTSGGVFSAIAKYVYRQGGAVYGCAYSKDMVAVHKRTACTEELAQLNGSKYVQSNTLETYREARRDLQQGKPVLYSGTPCQIAGLYAFLGDKPENLITADLVCHGVPSPGYFRKFVDGLSASEHAEIVDVAFRDKKNRGWSLSGTYTAKRRDGKECRRNLFYFKHYYYGYFLSGDLYRACCYHCQYANMNRCGDFTLGDLWGAEGLDLSFSTGKGCSLVLANTEKAQRILEKLEVNLREIPEDFPQRTNQQLVRPARKSPLRPKLYEEYTRCSPQHIQRNFAARRKKQNIIGRVKNCIPNTVKRLLLRIKYKKQSGNI